MQSFLTCVSIVTIAPWDSDLGSDLSESVWLRAVGTIKSSIDSLVDPNVLPAWNWKTKEKKFTVWQNNSSDQFCHTQQQDTPICCTYCPIRLTYWLIFYQNFLKYDTRTSEIYMLWRDLSNWFLQPHPSATVSIAV